MPFPRFIKATPSQLGFLGLHTLLSLAFTLMAGAETRLGIETRTELSWPTSPGKTYQPQSAPEAGGRWTHLGPAIAGDGTTLSLVDPVPSGQQFYQVLEIVPGTDPTPLLSVNGGFETANGTGAAHWTATGNQPPNRTDEDAHTGSFSMRSALANIGTAPSEGGLQQQIAAQGGSVIAGQSYDFSFWAKPVTAGPSYLQQYQLQWLNSANSILAGGIGLSNFSGTLGTWGKIAKSGVIAPAGAVDARVTFRFVTGAVAGGHGEVLIDDVLLDSGGETGGPETVEVLPTASRPVARISWPTTPGTSYQPAVSTDFKTWNDITPLITGDGGVKEITVPMTHAAAFFRVAIPAVVIQPPANLQSTPAGIANAIGLSWEPSPTSGVTGYRIIYALSADALDQSIDVGNLTTATIPDLLSGQTYYISIIALTADGESAAGASPVISAQPDVDSGIVALFNSSTPLEAETTVHTSTALITRIGDRARDRHAREDMFNSYDHYLPWYWEQRTMGIEIIDRVAKGGQGITFNYTTLSPLSAPEFRAFFRGLGTVAEYHFNLLAPLTGPNQYTATLTSQLPENRPLRIGDRVEIEISMFLQAPANGRSNYYGTTMLYIVGQGIVPWQAGGEIGITGIVGTVNRTLDSYPLPKTAWLGGQTTLPYQYSNEPEHRFKQTAGNISPSSIQPFMLGRRLHHTNFGDGTHSEAGNPVFTAHTGKLGPKFIARSCVECHVNNGRALPPAIGAPMLRSVVKVGSDASGSPHPVLGAVLQPQSTSGPAEVGAVISSYTDINGQYADGTPYSLRKPNYTFQGVTPSHFSVRLTPPLVGLGLLEAVEENTILALADPNDLNQDGVSGRIQTLGDPESGQPRLGRFTAKAGQAKVSHQIAKALNHDMGVTTALFPTLDGQTTAGSPELSAAALDEMSRYVSLLGVGARRDLTNSQALRGEQLFSSASCTQCHTPTLTTSPHHPLTELRNQTIHPYTDLLLHDMGPGLADNMGEASASGAEWRTAPLWNIGFTAGVSGGEAYLHDGRARSIAEAILWHGGEAETSKQAFLGMSADDRAALVAFLKSL
ncbi:MAG: di-heme oxidoredictase family protein [Akkermansiaceae bacterium]